MPNLNRYVGRIVRLNHEAFQAITRRARRKGTSPENCFVVASVSHPMRKLICFGGDFRVAVGIGEVALI